MHALAAASSGGAGAGGIIGAVILIVFGIAAYWAPTVVAGMRHVPNLGSVIVINLFLGWTLIGWVAALAMACRSRPQPAAVPGAGPALRP